MALEMIKSDRTIKALKPGAGRLSDGGGLYLLPFVNGGSHGWRFDYTYQGKRKTLSLGVYPQVGLAQARQKAAAARSMVAAGQDPSDDRRQQRAVLAERHEAGRRQEAGEAPLGSFEEVARRWFHVRQDQWMQSYSSKVIARLQNDVFPFIGSQLLSDITPKMLLDMLRRVEARGVRETTHRVLETCSNVFRFAIAEGHDLTDPGRDLKGALKKPQCNHFAAITKPQELARLLGAIEAYEGSYVVRAALKLSPMLLVRPGELRRAQWCEFDLDNGLWYVPSARLKRTKLEKEVGEPHFVPLSTQAVQVLEELFLLTGHLTLVFPGERHRDRPMSENTVNAALRAMGYAKDEMTAHGFRATARTLIVEALGFDEAVAEMQLAHAVKDANGTAYNRAEFLAKRQEMMQAWSDYLEDLRLGRSKIKHSVLPEFKPVTLRLRNTHAARALPL